MALTIFVSYVSEDEQFAKAIAERLRRAFNRSVDVRLMADFAPGINYRTSIDEYLDRADILLVIATGHEKLSHSFTGYEVGYFRKSQKTRKHIDSEGKLERLIIPIAVFADIPATLADIEGIGISEDDHFLFDASVTATAEDSQPGPLLKLLTRIDGIFDRLDPGTRSHEQTQQAFDVYRHEAQLFRQELAKVMSTVPLRTEFPKTRLSLRLPADYDPQEAEFDGRVMVSCKGPTAGIFQREQSDDWFPWTDLCGRIGPTDVALAWNDALRSLIASALTDDFVNSDQLVFSFDEKRLFRLFVSRSTAYFDRTRQLDIYVVEALRHRSIGDPFTTYLAYALAVALRYRSLFLEAASPYGPNVVRISRKDDRKQTVRAVLRELRLLMMQSRQAGLGERAHIIELYGVERGAVDHVSAAMKTWLEQKDSLCRVAEALLQEPEITDEGFEKFSATLDDFCQQTRAINTTFTSKVLEKLGELVKTG